MIDARLLVSSASAWLGAALTLSLTGLGRVLALAAVVVAIAAAGAWTHRRVGWSPALLAVALLVAGVGAAVSLQWRLSPEPMSSWAVEGATTTMVASVTGEPRVRAAARTGAWWAPGDVSVRVMTRSLQARGVDLRVEVPILVRLPLDAQIPVRGTVIRATGRLGPAPLATGQAGQLRLGSGEWTMLEAPGPLPASATALRSGLARALRGSAPAPGSIVRGLVLGDETGQPEDLHQDMQASGLAHLMAVSGGNVAIVTGVVLAVTVLLGLPLWARVVLGCASVASYAYLVGLEPSVLRAGAMGIVILVGLLLGGRRGGPSVLAAAVLALVLVEPSLALSWGFALSAVATAGIILLAPVITERLARAAPWCPVLIAQAAGITLAAQAATLPLLVAMGGASGWVALPANLVAMPLVAPVTVLGLAAAVLSPLLPPVADLLAAAAVWPAQGIVWAASTAPRLPGSGWPVGPGWPSGWPGVVVLAVVAAGIAAVLRARRAPVWRAMPRGWRWSITLVSSAVLALVAMQPPPQRGWPPPGWLMIMCDVGQGDGLILHAGPAAAVVVDAGVEPDLIDRCLSDAGIRRVPAVILTHFHADHVGGLEGVTRGRAVGVVLASPLLDPRDQALLVEDVVHAAGLPLERIAAGDEREVGDVRWRAVWPRRIIRAGSIPNNASVVLVVETGGRTVLLTGDVEPEAQAAVLADVRGLHPDVVKVPHHGSRHQLMDFAREVRAPIALVSVGADNEYGHPDPAAVAAYVADDGLLVRTDQTGDAAVVVYDEATGRGMGLGVVVRGGMLPSS